MHNRLCWEEEMIPKRRFRPYSSIASAHAFGKILPTRIQLMGDLAHAMIGNSHRFS